MTWGSLILTLLKLALVTFNWVNERKLLAAGEDKAIAAATLEVLKRTARAREIESEVDKLTDDAILASLAARGQLRD